MFWGMGTYCTNTWNEIKVIALCHSADITRCLGSPPNTPPPPVLQPLILTVSSVLLALQNHCLSPRPPSQDHNEVRQTRNSFMGKETIKKALMTLPLMFSLLCDKNKLFEAKRTAELRRSYKPTERKREISQLAC